VQFQGESENWDARERKMPIWKREKLLKGVEISASDLQPVYSTSKLPQFPFPPLELQLPLPQLNRNLQRKRQKEVQ